MRIVTLEEHNSFAEMTKRIPEDIIGSFGHATNLLVSKDSIEIVDLRD